MSSRTCESCLGSGEKVGIGHMPGYKCKKCSGTGIINNFTGVVATATSPTPDASSADASENNPTFKKRGRPPKIG